MKCTPDQANQLRELVAQVQRHQGATSDAAFCKRYAKYVGTTRTWKDRLLAGVFDSVDVPKKIEQLRLMVVHLEGGTISEDFYEDLPFNKAFQSGLARLESQTGTDRRIFCVLGSIGVGKTMSCKAAFREVMEKGYAGPKRILIIVPEALRENKVGLLEAIAGALGCSPERSGAAALMDAIKPALSGTNVTLVFDEAHQGGVMLMRIIKDLVNLTSARFVYVALRTEYMRVITASRGNITEAKQFVRRCLQPVFNSYADGTLATKDARNGYGRSGTDEHGRVLPMDAAILLARKSGLEMAAAKTLAAEKLGNLRMHGNLSSLSDAIDEAQRQAEDAGEALTPEMIKTAIDEVCPITTAV